MPDHPDQTRPLSVVEFEELGRLLARFDESQLDQWAAWQLETSRGPVFIDVSRQLPDGQQSVVYASIWPPPSPGRLSRYRSSTIKVLLTRSILARKPSDGAFGSVDVRVNCRRLEPGRSKLLLEHRKLRPQL